MNVELKLPLFPLGHPFRQHLNSSGFLYYHRSPKLPDTAGGIRIRLTPFPDASTFKQGRDLEYPDSGMTWYIPLLRLASDAQLDPLCQKLVHDQLVTPSLVMHCKNLDPNGYITWWRNRHILHTLSQPFQFNFAQKQATLYLVGHDTIGQYTFKCTDELGKFTGTYPVTQVPGMFNSRDR